LWWIFCVGDRERVHVSCCGPYEAYAARSQYMSIFQKLVILQHFFKKIEYQDFEVLYITVLSAEKNTLR